MWMERIRASLNASNERGRYTVVGLVLSAV